MKLDNLNHHLELERKRIQEISLYPGYEKYLAREKIEQAKKEIFKMKDEKDEL